MYTLTLDHHFDSAHRLMNYQGACANLHGHRWQVQVIIGVETLEEQNGDMVIDFKKLKAIINEFDHAFINDLVKFNPTAENIVRCLHERILTELHKTYKNVSKLEVKLWESPEAVISYQ